MKIVINVEKENLIKWILVALISTLLLSTIVFLYHRYRKNPTVRASVNNIMEVYTYGYLKGAGTTLQIWPNYAKTVRVADLDGRIKLINYCRNQIAAIRLTDSIKMRKILIQYMKGEIEKPIKFIKPNRNETTKRASLDNLMFFYEYGYMTGVYEQIGQNRFSKSAYKRDSIKIRIWAVKWINGEKVGIIKLE